MRSSARRTVQGVPDFAAGAPFFLSAFTARILRMASNVRSTWEFLRGKGLSPAQAAGVIGSMQGESGPDLNPAAVNPNGGATGIAQWLGARKTAAVESKQLGPQLNHLWGELQGPESAALKALKGTHTPEQAAIAWQRAFERGAPFEQKYNLRASNARKVFQQMRGVPGSASAGGIVPSGDTSSSGGQTTTTTGQPSLGTQQSQLPLVQALLDSQQSAGPPAANIQAPSFSAHPTLPEGFGTVSGGGGPAPKADIGALAAAVKTLGGDVPSAQQPSSTVQNGQVVPTDSTLADAGAGQSHGGGASSALSWAKSKVGAPGSQESGGENQGKLAGFLNSQFGMSGQPWCAMFTSAAVTKGGAPSTARTASVAQVRQKAQQGIGYERGFVHGNEAKPGDLILFGNDHIGMVESAGAGRINYVGGNQSDGVHEGVASARGATVVRPKYGQRRR